MMDRFRSVFALIILGFFLSACTSTESVPFVEKREGYWIEFESNELGIISTRSEKHVSAFLKFYNSHLDGWEIPWHGALIAKVSFKLFQNDKLVGTFGVSDHFITRGFWLSKSVSRAQILEFAKNFHPALTEGLYPNIPNSKKNEALKSAQGQYRGRINLLNLGSSIGDVLII